MPSRFAPTLRPVPPAPGARPLPRARLAARVRVALAAALTLAGAAAGAGRAAGAGVAGGAPSVRGDSLRGVVYRVRDARGHTLHLIGSVHLLDSASVRLPVALDAAVAAARVVAFELHLDSAAAQTPALLGRGLLPADRPLARVVAPATDSLLRAVLPGLGVATAQVQRLKPWLLSLQLAGVAMQRAGFRPEYGLDRQPWARARAAGVRVVALETAAEQIAVLDGLPADDQEAMLRNALGDVGRAEVVAGALRRAWRAGDVRALDSLAFSRMAAYPRTRAALFDDRNARWVPQVERLLADGAPAAVVVGAGHLVGPRSVVALLRDRGYDVEQQ